MRDTECSYWRCHLGHYNAVNTEWCPTCGQWRDERQRELVGAGSAVDAELKLHNQIIQYCRDHDWAYIHANPSRKSTITEGAVDFVIYASGGRVFSIECKTGTGKQSPKQLAFQHQMEKNGHRYLLVRCFDQFLALVS